MLLNKHIAALSFILVAFLAAAGCNEIPPDASGLRPANRNLRPENLNKKGTEKSKAAKASKAAKDENLGRKNGKKKGAKKSKTTKASKAAKASKPVKDDNSDRTLDQSLQDALAIREGLRTMYNYDVVAKENCIGDTNTHRTCIYDMFQMGGDFECECRPIDSAEIFEAFDVDNDDYITLKEVQNYFDSDPCEPSFIFDGITYTSCTTAGDINDREWCSIRVLSDNTHAVGFYKYCNPDDNELAWEEALLEFDTDGDGILSFDEVIKQTKERRRRLQDSILDFSQGGGNCNDCNVEDAQRCLNNPIVATIDGECRNYIKTTPFDGSDDDEKLLQMLGAAMVDSYDNCADPSDLNYLACPTEREGMDGWMTRTNLSPYPETDSSLVVLSCVAVAAAQTTIGSSAAMFLMNLFLDVANVLLECGRIVNELTDGRDALQWGTYTINQGLYSGKTILAYMGTKPGMENLEQVIADVWSVPLGNDMMRNMTDDAVAIALTVMEEVGGKENLFITGHSLGGIVAELVCSELGIEGASFGAIGAYDPFSVADQEGLDSIIVGVVEQEGIVADYAQTLLTLGYEPEEIEDFTDGLTVSELRNMLIVSEYNGLIKNTAHAGVKFEVVKNTYDYVARSIGSIDGSQCSHIAKSCEIRKLWFEASRTTTVGHGAWFYQSYSSAYYTRGWQDESEAEVDWEKLFLPGVKKNVVCDLCMDGRNEWCDSGNCYAAEGECRVGDRLPTYCPADSTRSEERADCPNGNDDCVSGRCDAHENLVRTPVCYETDNNGDRCNENSDCQSGRCRLFRCAEVRNQ
eukprot:CAMPEP_0170778130 /NCGR_PEP_ID=MMETSP0733-20121128/12205_1 /TAXON_ID=186038 /ORGANISM="Fragilariopsis kerguelensis, Strain L26-C5" /LENGTH=803 /DNA_ID=CAMNT_0011121489 /DNA_START=167 /DNA_END=2578 /DNA_ORIENTATION=-